MKIVYVSRSVIPSRTANSIHVMRICQAFAQLGHEVTLLAPVNTKLEEKGVEDIFAYYGTEKIFTLRKLFSPNIKFLRKWLYSWRCLQEIKRIQPEIVYGRNDLKALWFSAKNGFNTGFEQHMPPEKKSDRVLIENMLFSPSCSKIVVISEALAKYYKAEFSLTDEQILIAHDGADEISDRSFPEHLLLDSNRKKIGYVGSLFKGRGIDIIIEMAKRLPQYDFHIIGGNEKDISYWKSQCEDTNIIFHGFVAPKESYKYRNMCDILLAPYQTEQEGHRLSSYMSPIKLFEYMSAEKPIIASDLPVIREILNDRNALLVSPYHIDEWVKSVEKLMENETLAATLAKEAYQDFNSHYTWLKRAENIVAFHS